MKKLTPKSHEFASAQIAYFAAKAAYDAFCAECAALDATLNHGATEAENKVAHDTYFAWREDHGGDTAYRALCAAEDALLAWAYHRSLKMTSKPDELKLINELYQATKIGGDTFRHKARSKMLDIAARLI